MTTHKTAFCYTQDQIVDMLEKLVAHHGTFAKFTVFKCDDGVICYLGRRTLHFRITPQRHEYYSGITEKTQIYLNEVPMQIAELRNLLNPIFTN